MANLSNINNKFIVTDGNNGRVLIGATNDIGATLFANHPSTTAPSLTFNAPAGQVFENEDLQFAFGLNNASPFNGYMQTRFVSAPYYRNLAINPLGGDVGIGTNSPATKLHIDGGDLRVRDSGNVSIQIVSSDSGQSAIQFGDDGDTNDGRIVYMNATDLMRFFTNDGEKMVIDSSGNVGIGTDSPSNLLHVNKLNGESQIIISRSGNNLGTNSSMGNLKFQAPYNGSLIDYAYVYASSNNLSGVRGSLNFSVKSTAGSVINGMTLYGSNDGVKLGIGTTSPAYKLAIEDAAAPIFFGATDATSGSIFRLRSNNKATTIFDINANGNVEAPVFLRAGGNINNVNTFTYTLQSRGLLVAGNSGTSQANLYLHRDDVTVVSGNVIGNLHFSSMDGGSHIGAQIQSLAEASWSTGSCPARLVFNTVPSGSTTLVERMRIDSSGNVGINETPAYKFDVNDEITGAYTTSNPQFVTRIKNKTNDGTINSSFLSLQCSSDNGAYNPVAAIGVVSEGTSSNNGACVISTRSGGGIIERMRITSAGRILMPGLDGKTQIHPDVSYRTSDGELFYQTSSERYKTDIVDLENCLDKVNSLRTVRFTDINTNERGFGLIAEETNEIIPEVVFTKDEQIEGISYSNLTPFLIKAIQELKAEIELLKSK